MRRALIRYRSRSYWGAPGAAGTPGAAGAAGTSGAAGTPGAAGTSGAAGTAGGAGTGGGGGGSASAVPAAPSPTAVRPMPATSVALAVNCLRFIAHLLVPLKRKVSPVTRNPTKVPLRSAFVNPYHTCSKLLATFGYASASRPEKDWKLSSVLHSRRFLRIRRAILRGPPLFCSKTYSVPDAAHRVHERQPSRTPDRLFAGPGRSLGGGNAGVSPPGDGRQCVSAQSRWRGRVTSATFGISKARTAEPIERPLASRTVARVLRGP